MILTAHYRACGFVLLCLLVAAGTASAQTPRTGLLMREKLGHTQKILEALTTSNQAMLLTESDALARIAASAKRRDLDAAAANYSTLTLSCYQCHSHLKDTRIAR